MMDSSDMGYWVSQFTAIRGLYDLKLIIEHIHPAFALIEVL